MVRHLSVGSRALSASWHRGCPGKASVREEHHNASLLVPAMSTGVLQWSPEGVDLDFAATMGDRRLEREDDLTSLWEPAVIFECVSVQSLRVWSGGKQEGVITSCDEGSTVRWWPCITASILTCPRIVTSVIGVRGKSHQEHGGTVSNASISTCAMTARTDTVMSTSWRPFRSIELITTRIPASWM